MQTSAYEVYRVAQARMADAHRDAERWRLAKAVQKQRGRPGWLERLGLRHRATAPKDRGGEADEARPSVHAETPRRALVVTTVDEKPRQTGSLVSRLTR